jgi:hypothetical protein
MKTLQIIPLLTLSALTGVSAFGQITYTYQNRFVDAYAEIPGVPDPTSGSDNKQAPGFAAFINDSLVQVGNGQVQPFDYAYADAFQNSSLELNGFSYFGNASSLVQEGGFAVGSSFFSIDFTVEAPMTFTLEGGSGSGLAAQRIARMALTPKGSGFNFFGGGFDAFWGAGESFSLSGLLEPGNTYSFDASLLSFAPNFINGQVGGGGIQPARLVTSSSDYISGGFSFSAANVTAVPEANTTAAGLALGGLVLWQWRRRRA